MRQRQPTNPLGPVLLAILLCAALGVGYAVFGIGRDALIYAVALLGVVSTPVIFVFGIAGLVIGIRRLIGVKRDG
jgi:hypothetical protein